MCTRFNCLLLHFPCKPILACATGTCFEQILIRGLGPNMRYNAYMVDMRYNAYTPDIHFLF